MAKELFDIDKYLPGESLAPQVEKTAPAPEDSDNPYDEARHVVDVIVSRGKDITEGYTRWRDLGFSLAYMFGENGRELFHRLSKMNPEYCYRQCDDQFTKCLRSKGSGITERTFWGMVKEAGIDLRHMAIDKLRAKDFCAVCADAQTDANQDKGHNSLIISNGSSSVQGCSSAQSAQSAQNSETAIEAENITFNHTFSDCIPDDMWPSYFHPILESMDDAEGRDKMILAAINLNSGIIPNFFGVYGGHTVYPSLYTIFFGAAASRKGEIRSCLGILKPLKKEIRAAYETELANYREEHAQWDARGGRAADRAERGAEPTEPEFRSPLIPANSSASAAYMALKANGGWGAMFETEADVLSQSLLSDYGDYSTGLRAAAHHETISLNRVRDKLHIEIEEPKLSVCITCTPGQLPKLFPSFENGLGSRFLFYGLNRKVEWLSPFSNDSITLDDVYAQLGELSLDLRHQLEAMGARRIQFMMSNSQQQEFNHFFTDLLKEQFYMLGEGISSFIFRMGLSSFRIAMTLTMLRRYSEWDKTKPLFDDTEQAILCSDTDFRITMTIMNTLVNHTALIYSCLAKEDEGLVMMKQHNMNATEASFFQTLGSEFTSDDARQCAQSLNINYDTARRYVGKFVNVYHVAVRVKNGLYRKTCNAR